VWRGPHGGTGGPDIDMAADPTSTHHEMTRSIRRSHGSFEIAFAPVLMALIGFGIDRTFSTMPIFTVSLAVVGVLGSFTKIYYSYRYQMAALEAQGAWHDPAARPATDTADGAVR